MARLLLSLVALLLSGCATLPPDYEPTESYSTPAAPSTRLARLTSAHRSDDQALSGFTLLNESDHSLRSRAVLTDLAERTIDAQYYLWRGNLSGLILSERLLAAAERGVKVRLLIDDIDVRGREFGIAAFDSHPNIQVRVYNPAQSRGSGFLRFGVEFLTKRRLNRRMHNKVFVADNELAIVGGRNIGDKYFGIDKKYNFRDLDLLAAGPVVPEVSNSFDSYWNSKWAIPVAVLSRKQPTEAQTRERIQELDQRIAEGAAKIDALGLTGDLELELRENVAEMVWAKTTVVFDDPAKVSPSEAPETRSEVAVALGKAAADTTKEIYVQTAYFVPGKAGTKALAETVARGVDVTVITNSLASNNAPIAHSGYMPYRRHLIGKGVKLLEVRPDASSRELYMVNAQPEQTLGLHTKAVIFDRRLVFVGTFNLDPRSHELNTEMGLFVESEALASRLHDAFAYDAQPDNAWEVILDENDKLRWKVQEEDGVRIYKREPKVSFMRRVVTGFFRILPLEGHL